MDGAERVGHGVEGVGGRAVDERHGQQVVHARAPRVGAEDAAVPVQIGDAVDAVVGVVNGAAHVGRGDAPPQRVVGVGLGEDAVG